MKTRTELIEQLRAPTLPEDARVFKEVELTAVKLDLIAEALAVILAEQVPPMIARSPSEESKPAVSRLRESGK